MDHNPVLELLVATRNPGKLREIEEALPDLPVKLRSLEEFTEVIPVDEAGKTYQENAILKALSYSKQTGLWALADDSGLEVDALAGMPGVLSARFGGEGVSDHERTQKLLQMLHQGSDGRRTARFVCCVALTRFPLDEENPRDTDARVLNVAEAKCEGVIAPEPRGNNGFGFDPVFIPTGYRLTFAELPSEIKGKISHRTKALAATREFLEHLLAQT
jgi:XTP/dITP diphosphohydrolase